MAALLLSEEHPFDPAAFAAFLLAQRDLGTKCVPSFVRVAGGLPMTQTNKVLKRQLVAERWECADPVWLRTDDGSYRLLTAADTASIAAEFRRHGREALLAR
jgi:fatty-acyl-CoA synthase